MIDEKILIVAISLIIGFILNSLLERYKARNIYQQTYSSRRLLAYEELNQVLFKIYGYFTMIGNLFNDETKTTGLSDSEIELVETWTKNLLEQYFIAQKSVVYFSSELEKEITNFYDSVSSQSESVGVLISTYFKDLKNGKTSTQLRKEINQKLKESEKSSANSLDKILEKLREEIKENPFKIAWPRKVWSALRKYFT